MHDVHSISLIADVTKQMFHRATRDSNRARCAMRRWNTKRHALIVKISKRFFRGDFCIRLFSPGFDFLNEPSIRFYGYFQIHFGRTGYFLSQLEGYKPICRRLYSSWLIRAFGKIYTIRLHVVDDIKRKCFRDRSSCPWLYILSERGRRCIPIGSV